VAPKHVRAALPWGRASGGTRIRSDLLMPSSLRTARRLLSSSAKKIDALVMAEKCVHIVRLGQNVATPTVQHGDL
jgi:hypothetical protein